MNSKERKERFNELELAILRDAASVLDGVWDLQAGLGQFDVRGSSEYERLGLAPKIRRIIGAEGPEA